MATPDSAKILLSEDAPDYFPAMYSLFREMIEFNDFTDSAERNRSDGVFMQ